MKHASLFFGLIVALGLLMSSCKPNQGPTSVFAEAESLMYTHPDSALHLLQAIPDPEQLTGQAQADYALLMTQAKSRNQIWATSDSLIRIAVDYYQNSDEMEQKAKSLLYLGDVMMDMERYADATLPLKQAEEILDKVEDPRIKTLTYNSLGYLNRKASNYDLSLSYYKKALAINKHNGYIEWIVSNILNIINIPIAEISDSADFYINTLLKNIITTKPSLQAKAYNSLGVYFQKRKDTQKAEAFFLKSIQLAPNIDFRTFFNLAEIYERQGRISNADSLYNEALKSPIWATKALAYENLYKRNLKLGQIEEATQYMNQYIQAVDSFYSNREASQIQEIQQKYDNEVILHQKAQIEIWLYRIVFSFLTLLGILTALAWYLKRRYKTKLQTLQEQINKITSSAESDKAEISKLNDLLAQSNVIKQALQLSTLEDIQALEFYLRIIQVPESYNAKNDFIHLKHWLNLSQNHFATRIKEQHPNLSPVELTLCCLLRMGYSLKQISTILKVQEETIRRNIYRASTHLNIKNNKDISKEFLLTVKGF